MGLLYPAFGMPSMDLTSLYALGLQAVAVIALVYLVAILGARAFAPAAPAGPRHRRKSPAYTPAASR